MNIEFWVDPACPFCWATARWAVDEVQPNREVDITWRPISLFFKAIRCPVVRVPRLRVRIASFRVAGGTRPIGLREARR